MSDFKFACPNCNQHIACDESYYGVQINCPTCSMPIRIPVPAASAGPQPEGSPPGSVPRPGGLRLARSEPASTEPRQPRPMHAPQERMHDTSKPDKNAWLITWLLSFFLGGAGVDRFYNGRTGLGVGKLLASLLTCGNVGLIWAMIDFILLLAGRYRDARGHYVQRPQGRYMTLQIIGIVFAAFGAIVMLVYVLWFGGLAIALITHSSRPNLVRLPTSGLTTNVSTRDGDYSLTLQVRDTKSVVAGSSNNNQKLQCLRHLGRLGLSFRLWANDHNDQFPFNVSDRQGGTLEYCRRAANGFDASASRHFQVLSNNVVLGQSEEPITPAVLVCPADKSKKPATDWSHLNAANVTYLLRTGPQLKPENPVQVLAQCPIHGTTLYCDGQVKQGRR